MVQFLDALDQKHKAVDEVEISTFLRREIEALKKNGAAKIPTDLEAANIAFLVSERHDPDSNPWNTYFQPMASVTAADGTPAYVPDVPKMPTTVFDEWVNAADTRTHPIIKARFSDLVWDFWRFFRQEKRNVKYAHQAIDAYIAATSIEISDEYQAWIYIERALELAKTMKNCERQNAAKEAAFLLHDRISSLANYMWWKMYDIFWLRRDILTDVEIQKIVFSLNVALDQLTNSDGEKFDPVRSLDAAERLATCHSDMGKNAESIRVLHQAGNALEEKSKQADGLLATAWLELIFNKYQKHKMHHEAERVALLLRDRGKDSIAGMKKVSSQIEISQEEMDKIKASYLTDDFVGTVENIVLFHIQKDRSIQQSADEQVRVAPLSAMISKRIFNSEGHVSAVIPGIQDDRDAYLMHLRGQNFAFDGIFLQFAFDWCVEKHAPAADDWISFCVTGSLIHARHEPIIRDGFLAWISGDWIKTMFIMVPVVEAVLRDIYTEIGGNPLKPSKSGGFDVIGMGQILSSEIFKERFQPDVVLHLKALYTDARGMNLRNELAHGLLHYSRINQRTANLVIHTMLMLASLRSPE
jgi:lysyl-tRNA synthetase class 1